MQQRQTPNLRRRDSRRAVGRTALYFVEGRDDVGWRSCFVIDASILGAGLELFAPVPSGTLIGQRVAIQIEAPADPSVSVQVIGLVRSVRPGDSPGGVRIGLQFVGTAAEHRAALEMLQPQ